MTAANETRTVSLVILFLGAVTLVGLVGLIAILIMVVSSDRVFDPTLLLPLVGITTGALGGLTGLLASTNTADPAAIAESARTGALADVASLAPPVGAHFAQDLAGQVTQMVQEPLASHFAPDVDVFGPPTTDPVEGPEVEPSGFGPSFP